MTFRLGMYLHGGHILLDTRRHSWTLFLWPGIPRLHYHGRRSNRRWIFPKSPKLNEPF